MPEDQSTPVIKCCRICDQYKLIEFFVRSKAFQGGYDTICLDCSREKVRQWRLNNPEKRKEQSKRESKKDYNHNKHLKATYGITRDFYLEMLNKQGGRCAVCDRHQLEFTRRLCVDHNHATGEIRALLCQHCNTLIGHAYESIDTLKKAINYLERYNG